MTHSELWQTSKSPLDSTARPPCVNDGQLRGVGSPPAECGQREPPPEDLVAAVRRMGEWCDLRHVADGHRPYYRAKRGNLPAISVRRRLWCTDGEQWAKRVHGKRVRRDLEGANRIEGF